MPWTICAKRYVKLTVQQRKESELPCDKRKARWAVKCGKPGSEPFKVVRSARLTTISSDGIGYRPADPHINSTQPR